jgi:hypothetical protein
MRCLACGGEMVLISAIEDWTQPVLGFERHVYMCPGCGSTEQTTAFNKRAKEDHAAEVAAAITPLPITPTVTNQRSSQGFLGRVLAKIRGR